MKSALGRYTDGPNMCSNINVAAGSKRQFMSPHRPSPFHSKKPSEVAQVGLDFNKRIEEKAKSKAKPVAQLWKEFKKPSNPALAHHKKTASMFQGKHKIPHPYLTSKIAAQGVTMDIAMECPTLDNILQQVESQVVPSAYLSATNGMDLKIQNESVSIAHIRTQSDALAQICLNSVGKE